MLLLTSVVFIGLGCLSITIYRSAETQLKQFLAEYTAIADEKSLNAYKAVARSCMYLSLVQIGIIVITFLSSIALVLTRGKSGIFVASILVFVLRLGGKEAAKLEKEAQSLTCANHELEQQYQEITEVWRKKPLPNF